MEKSFKYSPQASCEGQVREYLFIGGHPEHHAKSSLPNTKSKQNFEGCLQQVYFKVICTMIL